MDAFEAGQINACIAVFLDFLAANDADFSATGLDHSTVSHDNLHGHGGDAPGRHPLPGVVGKRHAGDFV